MQLTYTQAKNSGFQEQHCTIIRSSTSTSTASTTTVYSHYLWSVSGSNYTAYDPFDGKLAFTFNNVPLRLSELMVQTVKSSSTKLTTQTAGWHYGTQHLQVYRTAVIGTSIYGSWGSQVQGKTFDASTHLRCYSWNVTIPKELTASTSFFAPILKVYNEDRVVGIFFNQTKVRVWALPLNNIHQHATHHQHSNNHNNLRQMVECTN